MLRLWAALARFSGGERNSRVNTNPLMSRLHTATSVLQLLVFLRSQYSVTYSLATRLTCVCVCVGGALRGTREIQRQSHKGCRHNGSVALRGKCAKLSKETSVAMWSQGARIF